MGFAVRGARVKKKPAAVRYSTPLDNALASCAGASVALCGERVHSVQWASATGVDVVTDAGWFRGSGCRKIGALGPSAASTWVKKPAGTTTPASQDRQQPSARRSPKPPPASQRSRCSSVDRTPPATFVQRGRVPAAEEAGETINTTTGEQCTGHHGEAPPAGSADDQLARPPNRRVEAGARRRSRSATFSSCCPTAKPVLAADRLRVVVQPPAEAPRTVTSADTTGALRSTKPEPARTAPAAGISPRPCPAAPPSCVNFSRRSAGKNAPRVRVQSHHQSSPNRNAPSAQNGRHQASRSLKTKWSARRLWVAGRRRQVWARRRSRSAVLGAGARWQRLGEEVVAPRALPSFALPTIRHAITTAAGAGSSRRHRARGPPAQGRGRPTPPRRIASDSSWRLSCFNAELRR